MRPLSEEQLALLAQKRRLILKARLAVAAGHDEMLLDIENELEELDLIINEKFKYEKRKSTGCHSHRKCSDTPLF